MEDDSLKNYSILDQSHVSRETCLDFEKFISMIRYKNHEFNIISRKSSINGEMKKKEFFTLDVQELKIYCLLVILPI